MKKLVSLLVIGLLLCSFKVKPPKGTYVFGDSETGYMYTLSERSLIVEQRDSEVTNVFKISEPQYRKIRLQFQVAERTKLSHMNGRFRDSVWIILKDKEEDRDYTLMRDCKVHNNITNAVKDVLEDVGGADLVAIAID